MKRRLPEKEKRSNKQKINFEKEMKSSKLFPRVPIGKLDERTLSGNSFRSRQDFRKCCSFNCSLIRLCIIIIDLLFCCYNMGGGGGGAVAQSVERATADEEVMGLISALSRVWQHVQLSDVSLETRPRYSLVTDEDVNKQTKQTNNQTNRQTCNLMRTY